MTKQTDGERLVALETTVVTLTKSVDGLAVSTKEGFSDITKKLDLVLPTYVTQTEFTAYKSSQNVQKALLAILMLIVGSLIGYFISNITK
jgi:hypothetical protein